MPEALATLLVVCATLAVAFACLLLQRGLREARELLFRAEIVKAESERLLRAEQQLRQAQEISESAVSLGTGVVRGMHRGIAAIPFGILEAIPATRDTTRLVRKTHDRIADAVYGSIGAVNRGVGAKLREGLRSAPAEPRAKPESPVLPPSRE